MTTASARLVGERQVADVALAHLRVGQAGALQVGARVGEHGRAEVEADAAAIAGREQLQHAARAGAQVDQQVERARAQGGGHGLLHVGVPGVQGTDAVPVAGMGLEVGLRRLLPLRLDRLCAPAVAHQRRIALERPSRMCWATSRPRPSAARRK